jgi:predicted nuclease with TOPRIM domain
MTTEIYNYIILSIVVLAYLHLWFYTFKYQKIEKKIENRINERFEDFITQKVASMENLVNNYTNQLKDITKARIKKIEITHEKFEESSTKILNNINNLENEYSEFIDILKEAVNVAKILSEEIEVKNNLIIQKNDHIKKLEAMIEQRNKKIKRLEDAKNN